MTTPDPSRLEGVVNPRVLDAMRAASGAMTALGVRHLVVGGLARADIVELIKAGIDVPDTRQYLGDHAPHFVESFDEAVRTARAEE